MDLYGLGGTVKEGVGAKRLRARCHLFEIGVALAGQRARVEGGGPRGFDHHQHVGTLVLDRLERADRSTELLADLGVLDRHLQAHFRGADLLCGQSDSC